MQAIATGHSDMENWQRSALDVCRRRTHEIELHVVDCEECRRKVAEVPNDPADALVRLLQTPVSETQATA